MTMYNMLFGKNSKSALLLAVLGVKEVDVPRFRDVYVEDNGVIVIYTRTGGGNRDAYEKGGSDQEDWNPDGPFNDDLRALPGFVKDLDDEFDSTYATFYFSPPPEFVSDVIGLGDIMANGVRAEFLAHVSKTLDREPTARDQSAAAHDKERAALDRTAHQVLNGHTFVPLGDGAMEAALKLAEENGGKLRSFWGILPGLIAVQTNFHPYPKAKDSYRASELKRIATKPEWKVDEPYWEHCVERFATLYPLAMAEVAENVGRYREKARA